MSSWEQYYKKSLSRPLRPLYLQALEFLQPGSSVAMDLGCGTGVEVRDLLQKGFYVHAVDQKPLAIEFLKKHSLAMTDKLQTHAVAFEKLQDWPAVDFLFSYLALPFCERGAFNEVFSRLKSAVKPGGVLAASFMGPNDDWTIQNKVIGISKDELEKKLSKRFDIMHITEKCEYGLSCSSGEKRWHIISVIAKKRHV